MRRLLAPLTHGGMWILFVPALLACLVHAPALTNNLICDDALLIVRHDRIAAPGFLFEIFGRDYGVDLASPPSGYYRPFLVLLAFVLRQLFGAGGMTFHLAGLLCLAAGAVLVTRLMLILPGERGKAWALLAGCLYAVHPARAEVASLFTSLPDLLIEVFILGLLIQMVARDADALAAQPACHGVASSGVLGLVFALLAGLSKEGGLILVPALLIVYITTHAWRRTLDRSRLEYALFVGGGSLLAVLCRCGAQVHGQHPMFLYLRALIGNGAGQALTAAANMVRDMVAPAGAVFMENLGPQGGCWGSSAGVFVFWGAFTTILLVLMLRGRLVAALLWTWVGGGLFLLMLTAVSHLPYAQRYLPFAPALVGGCLLCRAGIAHLRAWGVRHGCWSGTKTVLTVAAIAYMLVLAAMSAHASFLCRDTERWISAIAAKDPGMAFAHTSLARLLFERGGDLDRVDRHAREALILAPDDPQVRGLRKILAKVALSRGDSPLALDYLEKVAVDLPDDVEIPYLKAVAFANLKRWAEAMHALEQALARAPDHPEFRRLKDHIQASMNAALAVPEHPGADPATNGGRE